MNLPNRQLSLQLVGGKRSKSGGEPVAAGRRSNRPATSTDRRIGAGGGRGKVGKKSGGQRGKRFGGAKTSKRGRKRRGR
ncbi:MAG: hypothetical protein IPK83_14615 [Planctomycetes bacterium]|nr:hypothetical protein [Planctomycetota bacterium]